MQSRAISIGQAVPVNDFDAVVVSTAEHAHAMAAYLALTHGKHVYCEKPLTHNVREARLVAKVAKETGVATQLGNQGHSGDSLRVTCEMIWQGDIGDVREVHAWTSASRWNKKLLAGRPAEREELCQHQHWNESRYMSRVVGRARHFRRECRPNLGPECHHHSTRAKLLSKTACSR